jgi:hypothetical protein
MRYLLLTAIAVSVAGSFACGQAEAAKKIHKFHRTYQSPGFVPINPDPSGGNAAAGGNNANSMSGSNSAGENAIGRTSGSGGRS